MARPPKAANPDTAGRILDVAEKLVQRRGYNGFSYADIAAEMKISTASLHYHYAGKAQLGAALLARYTNRFMAALERIDTRVTDAPAKLDGYSALYASVLRQKRFCLCGMLAAEYQTLPKPMRDLVIRFFDENEAWLRAVLEQGREQGDLAFVGRPRTPPRWSSPPWRGRCWLPGPTAMSAGSSPPRNNDGRPKEQGVGHLGHPTAGTRKLVYVAVTSSRLTHIVWRRTSL